MDSRAPHPYPRAPSERTLIHNPNHPPQQQSLQSSQSSQAPPPPPPPPSFAGYPPASQPQPTVHAAFTADPYPSPRRDPFLPGTAHHARRSSYGINVGEGPHQHPDDRRPGWGNTAATVQGAQASHPPHHHAPHPPPPGHQPGPPPPPSMSNAQNVPRQPLYGYDPHRKQSAGAAASPPSSFRGELPTSRGSLPSQRTAKDPPSHDHPPPPPPPPPFSRSHMPPPPASPQQQQSHAPQGLRTPLALNNLGGPRDPPGLGPGHRPGSSMSISSIIGIGDTGAPPHNTQSHSSPPGGPTNPPSSSHPSGMQPPSPRRGLPSVSRADLPPFRRQPSPDRHMYSNPASRPSEGYGYPAGSPPRPHNTLGSPDQGRPASHQTPQPYKPMVFQEARPYGSSPNEAHTRGRRESPAGAPPRPSSQPQEPAGHVAQGSRSLYGAFGSGGGSRNAYGPFEERRRTLGEAQHSRPNVAEILGPSQQASGDRDRAVTVQPLSHAVFSPPRDSRTASASTQSPRSHWRHSAPEATAPEMTETRREEPSPLYRGYGGYSGPSQGSHPYGHHAAEEMVRGRSLDHLNHRVVEQYHAPPTSDPHANERQKSEQLTRSLSSGGIAYPGRTPYEQGRRIGDEVQNRHILALGPEANRRTGRASPLPQAVQGAQAQPVSIGKDPGIKSEFGRMFSGLGSGLGSSTPSRQSPMPHGPHGGPENMPSTLDFDLRLQRVNSQNGRKPKRVKDEEGGMDTEGAEGRGTPSGRGSKRNKSSHAGHHHHHHVYVHHHHHVPHRAEEEGPLHVAPKSTTPLNGARYPNLPLNGAPSHHHHHHHAAPHHHHHAPRASQPVQLPSPKLAAKVHDIKPVLDEAARYPRHHLGSYLYEAVPVLPKPNSAVDEVFHFASKPKPLPAFNRNPINCIVTCRIPRYYLKSRQRQQIVLQRHLWGAGVYRDDSDPLAVAIHSGWIRGEWDESVDVKLLDPRITAPNDPADVEDQLMKKPAAPVTPPVDMELYIDLLILPRLEQYEKSVEYGISSRKSTTHDGLSFMIHSIRWVDEGLGTRGQERTAEALKKRLEASRALLSLTRGGDVRRANETTALHA
ncbi:Rxt3-domain-containing protein [Westerdykella ornata]|uniref:Rxt3-domain-containing protein n=1 Tax=Westerdykella ornata TaxID=318751 RepID=A0A6A6JRV4_WESOR|nr:Rxt3-domain-containing protein [Westerdykella ornata]KAF2277679.1 Rxt3-domain-containing protein [Westerdykella ornata]